LARVQATRSLNVPHPAPLLPWLDLRGLMMVELPTIWIS
jgi:hypothetical protein